MTKPAACPRGCRVELCHPTAWTRQRRLSSGFALGLLVVSLGACAGDDGPHGQLSERPREDGMRDGGQPVYAEAGGCVEFCDGPHDAGPSDAATQRTAQEDAGPCIAEPEQLERRCTRDDQCVSALFRPCCSADRQAGVVSTAPQRPCAQQCITDCIKPEGVRDDEGRAIGAQGFAVACVQGLCVTQAKLSRFGCGTQTCVEGEYCYTIGGGVAGSPSSRYCQKVPGFTTCATFQGWGGCTCVDYHDAGLQVSCSVP